MTYCVCLRKLEKNQSKISWFEAYTHTHPSRTAQVSRYQKDKNQSGFYWSKREWVAVASAQFFTGWMPFLLPNQQRQSSAGKKAYMHIGHFTQLNMNWHVWLLLFLELWFHRIWKPWNRSRSFVSSGNDQFVQWFYFVAELPAVM